jgi:hypothetical protein
MDSKRTTHDTLMAQLTAPDSEPPKGVVTTYDISVRNRYELPENVTTPGPRQFGTESDLDEDSEPIGPRYP